MDQNASNSLLTLGNFPPSSAKLVQPLMGHFPEIAFPRDRISDDMQNAASSKLLPVTETLAKRVINAYMERGLLEGLLVAQQSEYLVVSAVARKLLSLGNWIGAFWPSGPSETAMNLFVKHSQTRNWSQSVIRSLAFHPRIFKLAVATVNDTICIYTLDAEVTPILKSDQQESITCLAWRPNSAGELAVGCETGVLLWTVDPTSQFSRPLIPPIALRHSGNKHSPVSSISWSDNGNLLLTASISDSRVYVWSPDYHRYEELHRFNRPCALVGFGPTGAQLIVSTIGQQFYIGSLQGRYMHTCWQIRRGSIQSLVWSQNEHHLLYVTTEDQELFHIQFDVTKPGNNGKVCALVDLKRTKTDDGLIIGGNPQSIAWCKRNMVLAIAFKDTAVITVFFTQIERQQFSINPYCLITGVGLSYPCCMVFQENYADQQGKPAQSVLTVGWSSGTISYYQMKGHSVEYKVLRHSTPLLVNNSLN